MIHRENEMLIQDSLGGDWLHFAAPVAVFSAHELENVVPLLRRVERASRQQNLWAAGFITYEAAPAFDPALQTHPSGPLPLIWFGLYPAPRRLSALPPAGALAPAPGPWTPRLSRPAYFDGVAHVRDHIARGETYQVNYSWRLDADFEGDPYAFFVDLTAAQSGAYGAYADLGRFALCCASPELFFTRQDTTIYSRPMKGTASRGLTLSDDEQQAAVLHHSVKNRAENVMIVDMIRNDLGRVAEVGTVRVPELFATERYPTLWQMTSTVTAAVDRPLSDLMGALFPCASITGAPKVRTMEIIRALERSPRGIYTGTIGYLAPDGTAHFNVAIRTVTVDRRRSAAEYGVGSGIVWDSDAADEYEECVTKAAVLTARRPYFHLLETIRWSPAEDYFLLERHLSRLRDSARYFGRPLQEQRLRAELAALAADLPPRPHRVRLLVDGQGKARLEAAALEPRGSIAGALDLEPVPVDDPFLYHKTTHRPVYNAALGRHPDGDDVLLCNENGEVTEFCYGNVVVELDGRRWTPPVACGLLAGTYRDLLLAENVIAERVIPLAELARASRIWRINSVGTWQEVALDEASWQVIEQGRRTPHPTV